MGIARIWAVTILCLSIFSLLSCAKPLEPAEFTVNKVDITPLEVAPSENVTVTAEIGNIGGIADNYTTILNVDGKERDRKTISINPSENKTVSFSITESNVGEHKVSIASKTGNFTVYEVRKYLLRHDNGSCSDSWCLYEPRGQWIKFSPPVTPFQIGKILIQGKRTNFSDIDKKNYTIKIWDGDFEKELYSNDFPYSNFNTGFTMVEHKLNPPLVVKDDFIVDFISHGEDPGVGKQAANTIYTCVDFTVNSSQYIGASWLGTNDLKQRELALASDTRWVNASWIIQVEGMGKNTKVTNERNTPVADQSIPPFGLIRYPNEYVDVSVSDYFYYVGADTPNCQLYCTITNKHEKWKMNNVMVRGVPLFSFINPGQQVTINKSIPCRNEGALKYNEFSWEWSQ